MGTMSEGVQIRAISGPDVGIPFRLARGVSAVVGRSSECEVVVRDRSLSRGHFRIAWDGAVCHLSDLGSTNGTRVNGEPVQGAILRIGDEIAAGDTVFLIEATAAAASSASTPAEGSTPPAAKGGGIGEGRSLGEPRMADGSPRHLPLPMFADVEPSLKGTKAEEPREGSLLGELVKWARSESSERRRLFAVIDGAQAIELAYYARMLGHRVFTLFEGEMAEHVAHAGPCLVELGEEDCTAFLQRWVEQIGRNAGILVSSPATLDDLFRHLRDIFVVTDEEHQEYFFRYYDPRVLRSFLPTCSESELREFFGVVSLWVMETDGAPTYEYWSLGSNGQPYREVVAPVA